MAVAANDLEAIEALLQAGASVDVTDGKSGRTPLFCAADANHYEACHLLITRGADVNATGFGGETALSTTMARGLDRVSGLLVEHGAVLPAADLQPPSSSRPKSQHQEKGNHGQKHERKRQSKVDKPEKRPAKKRK